MHKLQFEPAWDKTISSQDRHEIIEMFEQVTPFLEAGIHFTFLWGAYNHKNELLITVLIHNFQRESLQLQHTIISYQEEQDIIVNGIFDVRAIIPAHTSMPWTFIFSADNQTDSAPDYIITY